VSVMKTAAADSEVVVELNAIRLVSPQGEREGKSAREATRAGNTAAAVKATLLLDTCESMRIGSYQQQKQVVSC
jgi:hypothetical protein